MSPDLKRLLYRLNNEYGNTEYSRVHKTEYIAIHKTKRKTAIWCLVHVLKNKGRDQAYFESGTFQKDLADFFFPDGSTEGFTKAKREGARSVVIRELNEVLAAVFKEEGEFDNLPAFPSSSPSLAPNDKEVEAPKLRPDVSEAPYEAEDMTVLDQEFMSQLKEIANE